jgi:hypothetical protein
VVAPAPYLSRSLEKMGKKKQSKIDKLFGVLFLIALSPVLIPLLLCILGAYFVMTGLLYVAVWSFWNIRGIRLLYVYSNSPHWKEYIETTILPRLPKPRIVLNWSERRFWKRFTLASMTFRHFGGYREFNPLAIIFHPFRRAKVFRFFEAFKDKKHGKVETLLKMETDFFNALKT